MRGRVYQGTTVSAWIEIPEPFFWRTRMVEYQVTGRVIFGRPGTYNDPPEGDEVELREARRKDPKTGEITIVPPDRWPFMPEDIDKIEETLLQDAEPEDYDYPDYDDGDV